jgi:hypothetical protein
VNGVRVVGLVVVWLARGHYPGRNDMAIHQTPRHAQIWTDNAGNQSMKRDPFLRYH